MTRLLFRSLFFGLVICLGAAAPGVAQDRSADAGVQAPAHVSVVEGAVVLERDGAVDDSPASMPLLAGDRVRTRNGRAEILFADGGTLHLDADTTVDFQSDDLVRLLEGRVRLSIPGPLRAVSYRVDAPAGWAQITEPGEYRMSLTRGQRGEELELAVIRGGAELATESGRTPLRAGERAYAVADAAPSQAYVFNSALWDAFDRWSESQRDRRLGLSSQYLPEEVRPYAASFDRYGTWRHEASYGYVWYPTVAVDWRPYHRGRWVTLRPYGWTWVGADPWAWPTHHYGRWGFSAGVWFWIPGRTWGPAWVSWAYAPDYVAWCPLGWDNRPLIQINLFSGRDRWHPWTFLSRRHFGYGYVHQRAVRYYDIDVRVRGSFAHRGSSPDFRGYAVPRATSPIRVAGTRTGRAVPRDRGGSPVYTNLDRGASRVGQDGRRVMVPPSRSGDPGARAADAARGSERPRAAARGAAPDGRDDRRTGDARIRGDMPRQPDTRARERYEPPAGGQRAPVGPRGVAPSYDRPGLRTQPGGRPDPAPSRRAVPRGGGAAVGSAPGMSAPPPDPYRAGRPGGDRQRSAPVSPGADYGTRAVPRGRPAPAAPSQPPRQFERRGPAPSSPSAPPSARQGRPDRAPDRGGDRGGAASRPRSGGQPTGRAVQRRGGGV